MPSHYVGGGVPGLIVVLISHRCGHHDSKKNHPSSLDSRRLTGGRGGGGGLKSWRERDNCFWQGSNTNMYMRENESSLSCQPLNWDIYDAGVEGRDGFLLLGMGEGEVWMGGGGGEIGPPPLFNSDHCALEQCTFTHSENVCLINTTRSIPTVAIHVWGRTQPPSEQSSLALVWLVALCLL